MLARGLNFVLPKTYIAAAGERDQLSSCLFPDYAKTLSRIQKALGYPLASSNSINLSLSPTKTDLADCMFSSTAAQAAGHWLHREQLIHSLEKIEGWVVV